MGGSSLVLGVLYLSLRFPFLRKNTVIRYLPWAACLYSYH